MFRAEAGYDSDIIENQIPQSVHTTDDTEINISVRIYRWRKRYCHFPVGKVWLATRTTSTQDVPIQYL